MKRPNCFGKKGSEYFSDMKTKVFHVNPVEPDPSTLQSVGRILREGGLVAFPTETVYGLGASALDAKACQNVYRAKGRPSDNPLIVHVSSPDQIYQYACSDSTGLLNKLMQNFMPGPLTVVLKKNEVIPDSVTGGLQTVAIRCPAHPVARKLIEAAGVPVAAPSANLSGSPSPTKAEHVLQDLNGRIDCILCGGEASIGVESTIISLDESGVHLLRPGFVTLEELEEVCGKVYVDKAVLQKLSSDEKPLAPGMKYRHYAPKANTVMVTGADENVRRFLASALQDNVSIICFEEDIDFFPDHFRHRIHILGSKHDPLSQARNLFSILRNADEKDTKTIYTRQPPTEGVGLAVYNRLIKACGFQIIQTDS